MVPFPDRLADAVRRKGNPLCVGLDPRWDSLPESIRKRHGNETLDEIAAAIQEFCLRVVDLVDGLVPVIKPQSAFFEACGSAGMGVLERTIRKAKDHGLIVILDSKRGDIASTAEAYANAALTTVEAGGRHFPVWNADAVTVNPYLGRDAVEPFIASARRAGGGVFVLVRTSNAGAGMFQDRVCDGQKLYQHVAAAVAEWNAGGLGSCGLGDVGAVVGATGPSELAELRAAHPGLWFLVPGYGAQGGTAADVAAAFRPDGLGAIINSSRGVTFPFQPADPGWETAIAKATSRAIGELAPAMGAGRH